MSRIGNAPIVLPDNVEFSVDEKNNVIVKGPKGQLEIKIDNVISIEKNDNVITFTRANESKDAKSKHGLYRALISNMVSGVTEGFKRELIVKGVGYRSSISGNKLTLNVGFSHPISLTLPEGISVDIPKANNIVVSGINKEIVGQFAAQIRDCKPVEPYHGYGIRYSDEQVIRKEGKKAK